ncbi:MAG: hypothetical protein HFI33_02280 [Lachnospiraceae bacterium]|nr:hypothetical protein [Lachnospiraceae bacterium]
MEYMDTVITRLSEIESAAVRISEDAVLQKKEIAEEYEKKTQEFDREIDAQTGEQLEQLRRELKEKAARELEEMRQTTQEVLDGLEKEYDQEHKAIVEQLLKKMIGE